MTLRRALTLSRNTPAIRLLRSAGVDESRHLMNAMGGLEIERMPSTLALALGAADATPLQMATGFATIVNGGHRISLILSKESIILTMKPSIKPTHSKPVHFALMKIFRQLMPNCLNYLKPINQRFLQTRLAHQLAIGYNQQRSTICRCPQAPRVLSPKRLMTSPI